MAACRPGFRQMMASLAVLAATADPSQASAQDGHAGSGRVVAPAGATGQPPELGEVRWLRGFDEARATASRDGRALLVLFDEVPGCGNCTGYGREVLSHPLVVEAIETLFTPVAVYNNIEGPDRRTLDSFKEPTWNNPVVRIVSADRTELAPRVTHDSGAAGLTNAMIGALSKLGRTPPAYLTLLADELNARQRGTQRATVAMHCFWEGEAALAALPGVVGTTAGFVGGEEVVEVEFDPSALPFETLVRSARQRKCASRVYARTDAQQSVAAAIAGQAVVRSDEAIRADGEPKYYLGRSPMRFVPMTSLQAGRVNAALGTGGEPRSWLSPRQHELLAIIEQRPQAEWKSAINAPDLAGAWRNAMAVASGAR